MLLSLRGTMERDDAALERVLAAWPTDVPLALELLHPSWACDAVHDVASAHSATLVATDLEGRGEPVLRPGPVVYVRLRREVYTPDDLERWAARLTSIVLAGKDVYAFFRHDDDGTMALNAEWLLRRVNVLARPEGGVG